MERFVCETYRTGENLEGVGYIFLKVAKYVLNENECRGLHKIILPFFLFNSNALAYAITETFGESVNVKEITRAARYEILQTRGLCRSY